MFCACKASLIPRIPHNPSHLPFHTRCTLSAQLLSKITMIIINSLIPTEFQHNREGYHPRAQSGLPTSERWQGCCCHCRCPVQTERFGREQLQAATNSSVRFSCCPTDRPKRRSYEHVSFRAQKVQTHLHPPQIKRRT